MNFLAHAYLSGNEPEVLFGNFVADGIKGKQAATFSLGIQKGIALHRAIDSFTDSHKITARSIQRLQPVFRKYSGVVVDIYYDHFLARNWSDYSNDDLTAFSVMVYKTLLSRFKLLPSRTRRALPFMIAQNWLVGYANLRDLDRVFRGMSRRTSFESGMENAVDFLKAHYTEFEEDFRLFFPELNHYCGRFIQTI